MQGSWPGLGAVAAAARVRHWWKPKAAALLSVLYAVIFVTGLPWPGAVALIPPAILTIAGIGALGHLINDWFDIDVDRRAGKVNRLASLSPTQVAGLFAAVAALAALPWLALPMDALSAGLLGLELALLVIYAMPPVRLKARPSWAVVTDAAYAYAVPAVLAAHTVFLAAGDAADVPLLSALFASQLALGARHFLNHLAMDRQHDAASGVRTLATIRGAAFLHRLVRRFVLPIELAALFAYLLLVGRGHPVFLPAIVVIFLATSALPIVLAVGRGYSVVPYRFSRTHVDRLHQDIVPLMLLGWLVAADWRFAFGLLAHVLLFYPVARVAGARFRRRAAIVPGPSPDASATTASTITVPRVLGPQTASAPPHRRDVTIAVANVNKGKYTETFVDGLIPALPYRVLQIYGGELPCFDADGRHFLSNWPSLQAIARASEAVLGFEDRHFLRGSIAAYLQSRDVRLVLAHFGPVGVEMRPIARDLGIPLIVHFHGYDVFHADMRRCWASRYPALFADAAAILGVSARMLSALEAMGAPRQKLVHLPAFVDLRRFPFVDRRGLPPAFLAVGRFAETKSPHLTLLAFHRVAAALPDATLTFIGRGGGGELFEACVILARALGLADRVTFAGVQSHADVAGAIAGARVFVQHSVTTPEHGDMEGKPVAVMEAMASGLPVVATRHSGIDELIEHGVTGWLVGEYDVEAMAEAMIQLGADDELAGRIGRAASAAIHGHPIIANHVDVLAGVIDRAIAAG